MRKLAALALLSLAVAADAYACTCRGVELERDLPNADAAMVGSVLERHTTATSRVYLFRLEQVYKGDLDGPVEVVSERDGAACGLELAVGQRVGLLLDRRGERWHSGLCSMVEPAAFLELSNVQDNSLPEINTGGWIVGILVLGLGTFFMIRKARSYNRLR